MGGTNPDTPTSTLDDYPSAIGETRLVGVDSSGSPIYFDEREETAFAGREEADGWSIGEEKESGALSDIVSKIGDVTGWDALSEFGEDEESNQS